MFIIEDEAHAERRPGEFATLADALVEVRRLAAISWDETPNIAPCQSWKTCGRRYEIVEYNNASVPWTEIQRIPSLNVSAITTEFLL
jgi:hypothetical protein